MNLLQTRLKTASAAKWIGRTASLCCVLALAATLTPQAKGAFTGDYALAKFTLTNTNADGSAILDSGGSLVFTGGNNGSGLRGTTDLVALATGTGFVSFTYSYDSGLDVPKFDLAGYLLGNTFIQLADTTGQAGTVTFPVTLNNLFGFRISTEDNQGDPGVLTVSNFNAPSPASAIPEPSTLSLMIAGAGVVVAVRRRTGRAGRRTGKTA